MNTSFFVRRPASESAVPNSKAFFFFLFYNKLLPNISYKEKKKKKKTLYFFRLVSFAVKVIPLLDRYSGIHVVERK